MRRTTIALSGIVLAAAWLGGCGDDTEQISKPEFVERANAICQEVHDELDPVWEAMWAEVGDSDVESPADQGQIFVAFGEVMDATVPAMHEMADDLRGLGAPAGDEELLETLFDDLDAAIDEFAAMVDAAAAGDEAAREYLDGEGDDAAIDVVNRRAQDYGLEVCGAGS